MKKYVKVLVSVVCVFVMLISLFGDVSIANTDVEGSSNFDIVKAKKDLANIDVLSG